MGEEVLRNRLDWGREERRDFFGREGKGSKETLKNVLSKAASSQSRSPTVIWSGQP